MEKPQKPPNNNNKNPPTCTSLEKLSKTAAFHGDTHHVSSITEILKKVGNAQVNGTLNVMQLEFLLIILNDQNDPTSKGSDPIWQLFSERKLRGNERTRRIPRVTIIHTETTVDCGLFLLNCLTRDSFHLQRRRKKESP